MTLPILSGMWQRRHRKKRIDLVKVASRRFLDLLEPIRDQLYRFAHRAAWRGDDVPDIIQDASLTAWRRFASFQEGTNFRAWMFQVLVNTVHNHNKRVRRQREVGLDALETEMSASMEREDAWCELLKRPNMLGELVDRRILQALDRLRDDERQCLLLRLMEGFGYKEISAMLDMPVGTIMSHVHRARLKLREDLAAVAVESGLVRESAS